MSPIDALVVFVVTVQMTLGAPVPHGLNSITDGPCRTAPKIDMNDFDLELALHFTMEPGYVPMASKNNYYTVAKLLGREITNDLEQLERSLCLKLTTGLFENVLTGFDGAQVELTCELNGIGHVTCFDKRNPTAGNTTVNLIWSDKQNMLSISCFPDGQAAWNVLSSAPDVDDKTKEIIFRKLDKFGFNRDNAMTASYDQCPI